MSGVEVQRFQGGDVCGLRKKVWLQGMRIDALSCFNLYGLKKFLFVKSGDSKKTGAGDLRPGTTS